MKNFLFCIKAILMLALAAQFCACSEKGNEADEQEKPNPQNKVLVGTKWTSQNWDYDFDDDGELHLIGKAVDCPK